MRKKLLYVAAILLISSLIIIGALKLFIAPAGEEGVKKRPSRQIAPIESVEQESGGQISSSDGVPKKDKYEQSAAAAKNASRSGSSSTTILVFLILIILLSIAGGLFYFLDRLDKKVIDKITKINVKLERYETFFSEDRLKKIEEMCAFLKAEADAQKKASLNRINDARSEAGAQASANVSNLDFQANKKTPEKEENAENSPPKTSWETFLQLYNVWFKDGYFKIPDLQKALRENVYTRKISVSRYDKNVNLLAATDETTQEIKFVPYKNAYSNVKNYFERSDGQAIYDGLNSSLSRPAEIQNDETIIKGELIIR